MGAPPSASRLWSLDTFASGPAQGAQAALAVSASLALAGAIVTTLVGRSMRVK
jgi:hypothetical protein